MMTAQAVAMAAESGANAKAPTGGNRRGPELINTRRRGCAITGNSTPLFYRTAPARTRGAVP